MLKTPLCLILAVHSVGSTDKPSPDHALAQLEPLIGTWTCKTKSAEIESSFRWGHERRFIEHDHTLRVFGRTHRAKEMIGWDPKSKTIKGWIFSSFGMAESRYVNDGNEWKIDVVLTRPDGTQSRKNKLLTLDGGTFSIRNNTAAFPEFLELDFERHNAAATSAP